MEFSSWIISLIALFIFIPLLIWFYLNKKTNATIKFSSLKTVKKIKPSFKQKIRHILFVLRILVVVLLLLAFARPREGQEKVAVTTQGIAIQMVLDKSGSMKEAIPSGDTHKTKFEVAKEVFTEFVKGDGKKLLGRRGDMIGLISFAGVIEENVPLTMNHNSLLATASNIKNVAQEYEDLITGKSRREQQEIMSTFQGIDGTYIGDALYYATLSLIGVDKELDKAANKDKEYNIKSKIIILLTDGENNGGDYVPNEAAELAKENGIKIYTIAVEEKEQFQKVEDPFFGTRMIPISKPPLDTRELEAVSKKTNGIFQKASDEESLKKIYEKINELEKSKFEEKVISYNELFQWFMIPALLLLILELILSHTVFRRIP